MQMSFGEVTSAPIVVTVDGQQVSLPKPKRRVLGELYALWVEQDREACKRALDDAGVSAEERKATLLKFASDCRLSSYPLGCLYEFGRAEHTLRHAGVSEEVIDSLTDEQLRVVALRMWGFKPPAEGGESSDPKAPAPSASPTTGT